MTTPRRCGSYELVELLGRGGMGEVWRAVHVMLRRPAAVKLIRPELLGGGGEDPAKVLRRFQREVQATSVLRSTHTVAIYDYGAADEGTFYYAMELLEGLDLRKLVERHGPLLPERVVHFLLQACDSLAEAHAAGLVHRDVKPANLFACTLGLQHDFLKVLDFGLVKPCAGSGVLETQLTVGSAAMGSPAFMPPEVAEGRPGVDARSDVYSLGCVAYWLLTGRLVFEAPTAVRMLMDHVGREPEAPSRRVERPIPCELDEAILHCLRKQPEDRPQDARELAGLLRKVPFETPWTDERAAAWWHERQAALAAGASQDTVPIADHGFPATPAPGPAGPPATPSAPAPAPRPTPPPAAAPVAAPAPPHGDAPPERPVAKKVLLEHRDRTIAALQEQFVESHINATELSRRLELAERAPSPTELDRLLEDLPYLPGEVPRERAIARPVAAAAAPAPAPAPAAPAAVVPAAPAGPAIAPADVPVERSQTFVAVFGGKTKRGKWYPARRLRAVSLFGGVELDLRRAEFQPGVTTLHVAVLFGGCNIYVPKGMHVDINGTAIFGGFDESASTEGRPPQGATPWLRIRGAAIFGGVEIRAADPGEEFPGLHGPWPPRALPPGRHHRRRDRPGRW